MGKIIYSPVIATSTKITTDIAEHTEEMGWIEEAVSNAINTTLIEPLKVFALRTWVGVIDSSFILCLSIAFVGAICGILGIKGGYKVTILSIVFYLVIRLFSYLMGWY